MKTKPPKIDFAVGGQAVIEGVMMRSPNFYVVSVRNPDGEIQMRKTPFKSVMKRFKWLDVPLVRGVIHLFESMMIGFKALDYSSDIFIGEDPDEVKQHHPVVKFLITVGTVLYVLGTLAFTLFLMKFLPLWVAEKAAEIWPFVEEHYLIFNSIDGITKIFIFISYILLISLIKDIRRVFQYHGAEHKSIWVYELGLPLTVENARKQTRFHPRCGTSFIFIVILMSIVVYTLIPPADAFAMKFLQRVAVLPLIAGVSYEMLKLSAKWQKNRCIKAFVWPGLLIQRLTTGEPDDAQLEVALHSLKASLEAENISV